MKKWFKKYRVRIRNIILGIVIIGLLTIIFLVIYGYLNNSTKPFFPSDRAELGQFGDYFGGTLNPIFGFASFTALLATIIYQAKELKLSRTELELTRKELASSATALANQNKAIELQSFEQTFFSWLNTYKDLLYSIKGKVVSMNSIAGNQQEGREFIYDLWDQYLSMTKLASLFFKQNEYDQLTNQVYEHLNLETKKILMKLEAGVMTKN